MTTDVLGTVNPQTATSWVPDDRTFGARLALVRQRMAWGNVKEAALACALPPESWRTWERDNVRPRDLEAICRKISKRTGCDLDWLLRGPGISFGKPAPAVRPPDNRPTSGPRTGNPQTDVRRPRRVRALLTDTPPQSVA